MYSWLLEQQRLLFPAEHPMGGKEIAEFDEMLHDMIPGITRDNEARAEVEAASFLAFAAMAGGSE